MKSVNMLGLIAMTAAALMAFVGSSTASATVLCATPGVANGAGTEHATCPEGWAYPGGTTIHAVLDPGVHATLTNEEGGTVITCKKSTIHGTTEDEGSATETVRGPVSIILAECTSPLTGGACTVTTIKGGNLEIHWDVDSVHGSVTSNGAEVTTTCASIFGNIHCIYVTNNKELGTLTGGAPATMDVEKVEMSQLTTSALCPGKAFLDAKYEVTEPHPLYVANQT